MNLSIGRTGRSFMITLVLASLLGLLTYFEILKEDQGIKKEVVEKKKKETTPADSSVLPQRPIKVNVPVKADSIMKPQSIRNVDSVSHSVSVPRVVVRAKHIEPLPTTGVAVKSTAAVESWTSVPPNLVGHVSVLSYPGSDTEGGREAFYRGLRRYLMDEKYGGEKFVRVWEKKKVVYLLAGSSEQEVKADKLSGARLYRFLISKQDMKVYAQEVKRGGQQ